MNRCQNYNLMIKRMANLGGGGKMLPSIYQQVEYLQSDGEQYINSGVQISSTLEMRIKGQMTSRKNYGMMAGGRNNASTNGRYVVLSIETGNTLRAVYGSFSAGLNIAAVDVNDCIYNDSEHKMYINGSAVANFASATFTNTNPQNCYIFSGSGYDTGTIYSLGCKIWYAKLYNNSSGTLLRDFIPCYRKLDNVAGMYDLVEKQFYTNAGSGEFILGPET